MSYDITLFIPKKGKTLEESFDPEEDEQELLESLTDGGININVDSCQPSFSNGGDLIVADDDDGRTFIKNLVAHILDFDEEFEKYETAGHVELNHPSGIQISVFSKTSIHASVPYWYEGEESRKILSKMWEIFYLLSQFGGYCGYDPQLERYYDFKTKEIPKDLVPSNDSFMAKLKRVFKRQ